MIGWKTYSLSNDNSSLYTVKYNAEFVQFFVHISSNVNIGSSWNGWQNILTDEFIRPEKGIVGIDNSGQTFIRVAPGSENIKFKSVTGVSFQNTIYAEMEWKRR